MPDIFVPIEELTFSEKLVNGRYRVKVPSFMDVHEWWGDWEKTRFLSMDENLKPGMVLLDIGAFDGWQSAILARFVGGGQNMILVEPVAENWPNIKATWEANGIEPPRATYMGFVGPIGEKETLLPNVNIGEWPEGPDYSKAIAVTKFKHIDEHSEITACLPLDTFDRMPNAINIDVEGAELLVLQSGERMLKEGSPLIWLSVHPEFMHQRYGHDPKQIAAFLRPLGYRPDFLGTDHEDHYFWRKF